MLDGPGIVEALKFRAIGWAVVGGICAKRRNSAREEEESGEENKPSAPNRGDHDGSFQAFSIRREAGFFTMAAERPRHQKLANAS
jgi:hypothetical protein